MQMEKEEQIKNSNHSNLLTFKITPQDVSESAMTDFLLKKLWNTFLPKTSLQISKFTAKIRTLIFKKDKYDSEGKLKSFLKLIPIILMYSFLFSFSTSNAFIFLGQIFLVSDVLFLIFNSISNGNFSTMTCYILYPLIDIFKKFTINILTFISQVPLALYFLRLKKEEIMKLLFVIKNNKTYEYYYSSRIPENYSSLLSSNNQEFLDESLYSLDMKKAKALLILDATRLISLIKQDEVIYEHYEKKRKRKQTLEEDAFTAKNLERDMQRNMQKTLQQLYEKI